MWFIFPQIAGLGQSPTSIRFAIFSLEEAKAYLAHPILGPRLRECAKLALDVEGRTARQIFGPVDEMKFRSSMTLFAQAARDEDVFQRCVDKYFGGAPTRRRLQDFSVRPVQRNCPSGHANHEPLHLFARNQKTVLYISQSPDRTRALPGRRAKEIKRGKLLLRRLAQSLRQGQNFLFGIAVTH